MQKEGQEFWTKHAKTRAETIVSDLKGSLKLQYASNFMRKTRSKKLLTDLTMVSVKAINR